METEVINGRTLVVRHTFPLTELQVGSRWAPADGGDREVEITSINGEWVEYRDEIDGVIREKDWFSFQVRYCLIVKIGANVIE